MMEKLFDINFLLNVLDLITLFIFLLVHERFTLYLCFIEFHNYMLITLSANKMYQQKHVHQT